MDEIYEPVDDVLRNNWPSYLRKDFAVVLKLAMSSSICMEPHEFDDNYQFTLDVARFVRDRYALSFSDREIEIAAFEYWKPSNLQ